MAGNSVPIWDNKKVKYTQPAGLDIAITIDGSGSFDGVHKYVLDEENIRILERQLRSYNVGIRGDNTYTYQGMTKKPDMSDSYYNNHKHRINRQGELVLTATGQDFLDYKVECGTRISGWENAGIPVNKMAEDTERFNREKNVPLFMAFGNEQNSNGKPDSRLRTPFTENTPVKYRYVGCMPCNLEITNEDNVDVSEDPIPAGVLSGHVWVSSTRGIGIYFEEYTDENGETQTKINYRFNVLNHHLTISTTSKVFIDYVTHGKETLGAVLNFTTGRLMPQYFESMGRCFAQFVYDPKLGYENNPT